jgi:hypothetical protein
VGQRAERERLIRERTALVDVTPGDEHRLSGPAKEALEHRPAAASLPAVDVRARWERDELAAQEPQRVEDAFDRARRQQDERELWRRR